MNQRKKIAFLIPYLGTVDRGAEVFVYELAKRLSENFQVTIFCRKTNIKSGLIKELELKKVEFIKVSSWDRTNWQANIFAKLKLINLNKYHINPDEMANLYFSLASLPKLLSDRFDVLFPVAGIWSAIVCRIIRFFRKTPFVYSSQGGIEPLIARQKPEVYFAIHPHTQKWLNQYFPKLNVKYIPNGVDLKRFCPEGKIINTGLMQPVVVTVSALVTLKQVDLTIKAVALIKNVSLLILGKGPLKTELNKLGEKIIGKKRFKIISVSNNKIQDYYRSAKVFAFSAPWEQGWGNVHLEALASGLPIVANCDPDIISLFKKTKSITCDVSNIQEYADAIKKALKIKDHKQPEEIRFFSWDKVAGEYGKEIGNIINNPIIPINQ